MLVLQSVNMVLFLCRARVKNKRTTTRWLFLSVWFLSLDFLCHFTSGRWIPMRACSYVSKVDLTRTEKGQAQLHVKSGPAIGTKMGRPLNCVSRMELWQEQKGVEDSSPIAWRGCTCNSDKKLDTAHFKYLGWSWGRSCKWDKKGTSQLHVRGVLFNCVSTAFA